ncbi:hypothetical protein TNCV_750161 [Trichonephila clavipes]|nr:hypothetical protein TNCV_750161 [Trichonephila clavipes]
MVSVKQVFFQNMHKEHSKTYIMHANIASFVSDTIQKTNAFEIGSWNSEDCFPEKIEDEAQSSASSPSGLWSRTHNRLIADAISVTTKDYSGGVDAR